MLEFQEGFFEQEVRDGFYIDTTMKTVWAAELEVLQKVAEICDRHGLVWYAAYGTLLGAIRHEGFVPWDDDMDIWMKRKDYNKLQQILPQELPNGYLVRSPLTAEGYDQFHTFVCSGNRISIDPEWLEQYHGCPFSVGLDIFPLDYLARDKEERAVQENLVKIAVRGVQVAATLFRQGDDLTENSEEKSRLIEEMREGVKYLRDSCNAKIDYRLIEEEKWFELASEFGKWGNYFAMMYEEEESDYLVNFVDYVRFPGAKYPKEWFGEVYGAGFESFMLPIPCGYDKLLPRIYGPYMVCRRKRGTHEYPYYARQLEELRKRVSDGEKQAGILGLIPADTVLLAESGSSVPPEWETVIEGEGGKRKKIILYENDISAFLTSTEKELDKLEETLKQFEKVQSSIALWWCPQRDMANSLEAVSHKFSERYKNILDEYKKAAWGICDETGNTERAVEFCEAYYGGLNAILQPFQNADKPIIIAEDRGENTVNNLERINELRAFLSLADFVEDDEKIYFANTNYNALVIVAKEKWQIEKMIPFAEVERGEQDVHLRCVKRQNKICFLPAKVSSIHMFDIEKEQQYTHVFENVPNEEDETERGVWDYHVSKERVYLLPGSGAQGLWRWNVSENAIEREDWWDMQRAGNFLQHGSMDEESFYSLSGRFGRLFVTNVKTHTVEAFDLPDEKICHITYDGKNFWYTMSEGLDIVCWNQKSGILDRYSIKSDIYENSQFIVYTAICYAADNLFLFSSECDIANAIYVLDKSERKLRNIYTIENDKCVFMNDEMQPDFKCIDNKLVCLRRNAGETILINLESLEVECYKEKFLPDEKVQRTRNHILLDRKALLYEGQEGVGLDTLFYYYMDSADK